MEEPYIYHFPDGNASLARLIVRSLIPGVAPGTTMEDVVTARFDYGRLDEPGAPMRLRLRSTVVHVRNADGGVDLGYVRDGAVRRIRAGRCVLAGYHMMIPAIMPELPDEQRVALWQNVNSYMGDPLFEDEGAAPSPTRRPALASDTSRSRTPTPRGTPSRTSRSSRHTGRCTSSSTTPDQLPDRPASPLGGLTALGNVA